MPRFSATIYKLWINPVVDPPEKVLAKIFERAGRSRGPIPVYGLLDGAEFRQTLVKYGGTWRLYINGLMLKSSGARVGDKVKIEIEFDPRPRKAAMPQSLRSALSNDANAMKAFSKLSASRQKEICRYIGSLKTAEAIEKNVEKVIRQLRTAFD